MNYRNKEKYNFYYNYGDLTGDSVVTDIYIKRIESKKRRKSRSKKKSKKIIKQKK